MFKNILLSGVFCALLSAESFDTFLDMAIKNSPYLQSSALKIEQAKEEGSILTRYKNPSLELEYSPQDSGYRVNISQPLRVWDIQNNKNTLAKSRLKSATLSYTQKKALFVYDIALQYIEYANKMSIYKLTDEELEIAQTIYNISSSRYEAGTIARGFLLQAKIDYEMAEIKRKSLELESTQSYYALLSSAGIKQEITLDTSYRFTLKNSVYKSNNPKLLLLQAKQEKSIAQLKLSKNKIEWIDLFAEYESDPSQNITRVGLNIPLAIFNRKSQEVNIAKLQNKQTLLLIESEKKKIEISLAKLHKERHSLHALEAKNRELLTSQVELLTMFQNGYKIANINLLQLQDIKNRVIATKKALITIQTALDKNAIVTNYIQGAYND